MLEVCVWTVATKSFMELSVQDLIDYHNQLNVGAREFAIVPMLT